MEAVHAQEINQRREQSGRGTKSNHSMDFFFFIPTPMDEAKAKIDGETTTTTATSNEDTERRITRWGHKALIFILQIENACKN